MQGTMTMTVETISRNLYTLNSRTFALVIGCLCLRSSALAKASQLPSQAGQLRQDGRPVKASVEEEFTYAQCRHLRAYQLN